MNVRTTRLAAVGMAAVLSSAMDARADLIFSNFDTNTPWDVVWLLTHDNQPKVEFERAVRFVSPVSFFVDAMELPVLDAREGIFAPPPGAIFGDSFAVAIYADDNGMPGQLLETVEAPDSLPPWGGPGSGPFPPPTMVQFAGTTLLEQGQVYWIGVSETEGSVVGWQAAPTISPLQQRVRVVDGPWAFFPDRRLGLRVHGTPDPQCEADTNGDGQVDVNDLLSVITTWGLCPAPCPPNCVADIVPNCAVDVNDLLAVVTTWGPCP